MRQNDMVVVYVIDVTSVAKVATGHVASCLLGHPQRGFTCEITGENSNSSLIPA
jgi:hypothetical protein